MWKGRNYNTEPDEYGPGTDLVFSLLAIFIIIISIIEFRDRKYRFEIEYIRKNQIDIINSVATRYNTVPSINDRDEYVINLTKSKNKEDSNSIVITNDVTIQRFSFGGNILFDADQIYLKDEGKKILRTIYQVINPKLSLLKEVQIQGHADIQKSKRYNSNLELAAYRSINIFKFFIDEGMDPSKNLLSISSYGEYKPVQRGYIANYDINKLIEDNKTINQRNLNRRIELIFIFRQGNE